MKKNLLKILALSAVVLSMGACTKKGGNSSSSSSESGSSSSEAGPVDLSILEVFAVNSSTYKFEHEGELVRVKNAACIGSYGTTLIAGVPYAEGGTITDLKGFEVELDAAPQWTTRVNGQYADITVEGTLADVNGRPVLKDASLVINGEAHYDEGGNRIYPEGSSSYSCGYWSSSQFVRSYYDEYMGRSMNGALVEGIFQLATVPTTVTATASQEFKIVFPGEDTNGTDEDNEYVINVTIPAGLSEKAINKANTFFAGKQVGDFFTMNALTRYDSTKGGMGLLYENYWCGWLDEVDDADKPEILTSWATIQAKYENRFQTPLPNIGCEEEGVFSYIVDDYFSTPIDEIGFEDASFILVDHDLGGLMDFTFNTGSAKAEAVFAALGAKALAAGFEKDTTVELDDEDAEAIYVKKDAGSKVVAELYFGLLEKGVDVMYIAVKNTFSIEESFAAAIAAYNAKLGITSGLLDFAADLSAAVTAVRLDWSGEDELGEGAHSFEFRFTFDNTAPATPDAWVAAAETYEDSLTAAGFAEDYSIPAWVDTAFFNTTTREYVTIFGVFNSDSELSGIYLKVVYFETAAAQKGVVFDVSDDYGWSTDEVGEYLLAATKTYFANASFYNGNKKDIYIGGYYDTAMSQIVNIIGGSVMPGCATYLGTATTPNQTDSSINDTFYAWSFKSANAGKVIQATLYFEAIPGAGASYVDIYINEFDAE